MSDEDRWARVRQIVREECERIEQNILAVLAKHGTKPKLDFVNGKWVGITEQQLEAWKAAYGAVDVEEELKKLAAWIVSNPHKAPKSQYARFLNGCLAREQNRAAIRSIPTRNEEKKKHCAYCTAEATRMVSGTWACVEHFSDALDGKPQVRMLGVVAKPVAGA